MDESREVMIILIAGSILFVTLTGILVFVILFYQRKKLQHTKQLLQLDKLHIETLLQSRIEIQEETFKNISQEIHDNIGQVLMLVKLNLNAISASQANHDNEKLRQSIALISKSIKDLRDVAKSINTDYVLRIGLCSAIRQQLAFLERTGLFETRIEEEGDIRNLGKRNELIVFRVVQELLNNIVKHANATLIEVRILSDANGLRLSISDNGSGFDITTINSSGEKGLGLSNMQNRVALINGKLDINSAPGKGTMIAMEFPWAHDDIEKK